MAYHSMPQHQKMKMDEACFLHFLLQKMTENKITELRIVFGILHLVFHTKLDKASWLITQCFNTKS
jgi:hypothetical protein